METPLVSAITLTSNQDRLLADCVDSTPAQAEPSSSLEQIVIARHFKDPAMRAVALFRTISALTRRELTPETQWFFRNKVSRLLCRRH